MEDLIKRAILMNPLFNKLTVQQQYQFIKGNIDKDIIPEDLVAHYESQWDWVYPSYIKQMY